MDGENVLRLPVVAVVEVRPRLMSDGKGFVNAVHERQHFGPEMKPLPEQWVADLEVRLAAVDAELRRKTSWLQEAERTNRGMRDELERIASIVNRLEQPGDVSPVHEGLRGIRACVDKGLGR